MRRFLTDLLPFLPFMAVLGFLTLREILLVGQIDALVKDPEKGGAPLGSVQTYSLASELLLYSFLLGITLLGSLVHMAQKLRSYEERLRQLEDKLAHPTRV